MPRARNASNRNKSAPPSDPKIEVERMIEQSEVADPDPEAVLRVGKLVARHGKLPPRRHEELPPPWIAEERANERGTNHGRLVVD
jgi:hypothetical protein